MEGLEGGAPVGVETDVLVDRRADAVAVVGDREFREVERVAGGVDHDLVDARQRLLGIGRADLERAHLRVGVRAERRDEPCHVAGRDERLVTLHVDVDVGGPALRHFPHAIGARWVRGRGEDGGDAVRVADVHDLLGVGGHEHVAELRRAPRRLPRPADQRAPGDLPQELARQGGLPGSRRRANPGVRKNEAKTWTMAETVFSRGRAVLAVCTWSVTQWKIKEAISRPPSVRPAFRAPASRCAMEAGTASEGIQFNTTPSAISPASSSISGPSAASTMRTGAGGATRRKFFTREKTPSKFTRSPAV